MVVSRVKGRRMDALLAQKTERAELCLRSGRFSTVAPMQPVSEQASQTWSSELSESSYPRVY